MIDPGMTDLQVKTEGQSEGQSAGWSAGQLALRAWCTDDPVRTEPVRTERRPASHHLIVFSARSLLRDEE